MWEAFLTMRVLREFDSVTSTITVTFRQSSLLFMGIFFLAVGRLKKFMGENNSSVLFYIKHSIQPLTSTYTSESAASQRHPRQFSLRHLNDQLDMPREQLSL